MIAAGFGISAGLTLIVSRGRSTPDQLLRLSRSAPPFANSLRCGDDLDLHVEDPESESSRLVTYGARRLGTGSLGKIKWITMADPEGNEFDIGQR